MARAGSGNQACKRSVPVNGYRRVSSQFRLRAKKGRGRVEYEHPFGSSKPWKTVCSLGLNVVHVNIVAFVKLLGTVAREDARESSRGWGLEKRIEGER